MTDNDMTDTKPTSIESMRRDAEGIRDRVAADLTDLRGQRNRINGRIKKLVAEHDEADRVVRALTPKTRTTKK